MSLTEQIENDYVQAYKAKDALRVSVLRMVKTAAKNRLVELRRPGGTLDDDELLDVFIKEAKQRQDSIEQYTAANRPDLAEKEAQELAILTHYLPKKLSPEELDAAVNAAVDDLGATGPRDMGRVISAIMTAFKGRADGKEVAAAVKKRLS
ncbi:MAG: GatB/YqeY domain-containing protein [Desulfovibrio sp.]|uniref:GatB/YqeY domain-containing protein n=1 Tax=Desulfovibrio sp. TaxID=885 RepID=UPI00198ACCB8|nr:GatB/YqeY domain-containing protein [Desulfovibrio sp.]MBD5417535.1 GatB/YqeY domain-containing protein [Desulfovibrio sp.]MBD5626632.1 GatB/YqeY domain-containing protein [Desulfovibrio sp.]MDE6735600.1 GatB/YqeY domain-containing protein [Desulfovibrio sp.]